MRMLCVLACVIEESALPSNLTSNLSAGSTAVAPAQSSQTLIPEQMSSSTNPTSTSTNRSASPSFIRSKFSGMGENNKNLKTTSASSIKDTRRPSNSGSTSIQSDIPSISQNTSDSVIGSASSSSLPKTTTSVYLGFFQNSSYYLKLYETLKIAFNSYKKSPNINTYDRFTQVVKSTLKMLAQLLESALSVHEIGPHLDELLLYLKIIFSIESSCSVKCVTLCLKSLFSLNLSGLMLEYMQQQINKILNSNNSNNSESQTVPTGNSKASNLPTSMPLSGFSSALSSSTTSISSQQVNHNNASIWSSNTVKRQETSLYSSLITNHLAQFTRFIYSQSIMFKSDNLIGIHFNQGNQILLPSNLLSHLCYI